MCIRDRYGIGGRARLFEVVQKVKEINRKRKKDNRYREFRGKSHIDSELKNDTSLELGFIIAPPRMAFYIDYSKKIYEVYLKYVSAEDIHVYSIDEVFIDATSYLKTCLLYTSLLQFMKKALNNCIIV